MWLALKNGKLRQPPSTLIFNNRRFSSIIIFLLFVTRFIVIVFTTNCFLKLILINTLIRFASVVSMKYLCSNLDLSIAWNEFLRDFDSIDDFNSSRNNSIVFHIAHRNKIMDFGNAKPVKRIRHECLETRILYTCNLLRAIEVIFGRIASLLTFAGIVHQILCHLTKRSSLFTEVYNDPASSSLCSLDTLLNSMSQVRSASADITSKHIRAVALIVNTAGQLDIFIWDGIRIPPNVYGQSTNRGQK
mmetsp:Transcript_13524/g.20597  ORF Transcript_13524/g.20597 Transcript_13524/m.20597 type:complete len:246 (+) Transcript_13524:149-886(+)